MGATHPKAGTRLCVIAGPTAAGKTALALAVAAELNVEIVGADSMQVYRRLDIGTAKPSAAERQSVPHHLIDVAEPDAPFDAKRYVSLADQAIAEIAGRGRTVIVVGGTGLYIRALLHGLEAGPEPDPSIRARLLALAMQDGWPALHAVLAQRDQETAARLHPNDGVRIVRALEVLEASGRSISSFQAEHGFASWRYEALVLGVSCPREELNRRIDARVDRMMEDGFLEEVRGLLAYGYAPTLRPLEGLGYKRLANHLHGQCSLEIAVAATKADTRKLAKRQLTWFKREPGLEWIAPDAGLVTSRIAAFINR